MNQAQYIPGVCNIGGYEVARRKAAFYILLFATIAVVIFNYILPFSYISLVILFFVSVMMGITYQQYANRFCIKYGWRHQFSLGHGSKKENVNDLTQRLADRKKVVDIILKSLLFAAVLVAAVYIIRVTFNF